MRTAQMKERPSFSLVKQTDVQTIYHMQMPRWLFSDPRYADMSLDAKVMCNSFKDTHKQHALTDTHAKASTNQRGSN